MSVGILCDRVWKGYYVTNRKRGTKLHEEKSIQGSIALHIANLCRILIFRNVLWISDAEHGISMLDKYQNVGWKKFYLIYGMCDETFSVNCTTEVPEGVDKGWFMFFVTLLNQIYWVGGATAGALLGYVIHFNTKGLEFVMTALFVVMFVNQWDDNDNNTGYSHNCSCGAWHNGDTVSAVFNFPGRKRTTGIFGDCIYRTPSQMEKEHIAQYRRWNCILYAAGAVCLLQVTQ